MEEKTTNERLAIFYKQLTNKLNFYKKLAIENIEKDIKNEKIDVKKNEYLELTNKFYSLFENEIKNELSKEIDESIFDDDLPVNVDDEEY